jgi:hypothetical protein
VLTGFDKAATVQQICVGSVSIEFCGLSIVQRGYRVAANNDVTVLRPPPPPRGKWHESQRLLLLCWLMPFTAIGPNSRLKRQLLPVSLSCMLSTADETHRGSEHHSDQLLTFNVYLVHMQRDT